MTSYGPRVQELEPLVRTINEQLNKHVADLDELLSRTHDMIDSQHYEELSSASDYLTDLLIDSYDFEAIQNELRGASIMADSARQYIGKLIALIESYAPSRNSNGGD